MNEKFMEDIQAVLVEIDQIRNIDFAPVDSFVEEILKARKVAVLGAGRSGLALKMLGMRLCHLGLDAYVAGETTSPYLSEEDLLIVASGKGENGSINAIVERVLGVRTRIWALTGSPTSRLAKMASGLMILPSRYSGQSSQFGGNLFEACVHVFGDALFAEMVRRTGQDFSEISARHTNLE